MNAQKDATLAAMADQDIQDFIAGLYRIFLRREPDSGGLQHHTDKLKAGTSLLETIAIFASSREFLDNEQRRMLNDISSRWRACKSSDPEAAVNALLESISRFPIDYEPIGEVGKSYHERVRSGFLDRYCQGDLVLDVGFAGYDNPENKVAVPNAIGVDLNYPGYDGTTLPFMDGTVDTVFSSHCLEHILYDHAVIRDWFRVLKRGGFIVCMVPSQALYEKRRYLPSQFNDDHKRMYTPSSLASSFEHALPVNSYRIRHLAENDRGYDYTIGPERHAKGAYEIEIVLEKIAQPTWTLA